MIPIPIPTGLVISAAAKLGIALVEKAVGDDIPERIGTKLARLFGMGEPKVSAWDHKRVPGLIWRLPDKTSPNERDHEMKKIDGIILRNNEVAIYRAGGIEQPLIPGVWKFESKAKDRRGAEVVFVSFATYKIRWGIPRDSGPMSKDGVQVGISGEARVRIINAIKFVNEIVKSKSKVTPLEVKDWIFSDVIAILRDRVAQMNANEISSQSLSMAVQAKGELELPKYGLKIEKLNVMYTALPEEFVKARRGVGIGRAEAERMKILGAAEDEIEEEEYERKADYAKALMDKAKETGVGVRLTKDGDIEVGRGPPREGPQFCPSCGSRVPENAKFCANCGQKLS